MFPSLESPQEGLSSRCHHVANCNCVWIFHMTIIILQFHNRMQISYFYHCGTHLCTITPFLWFYDRMRNSHFYYSNWLQLVATCDATICSLDRGCQAGEFTESLTSSPLQGPATASRLQARYPALSGNSWTLISLPRDPNTLELRAYRKEPNPMTSAILTLFQGPHTECPRWAMFSGALASCSEPNISRLSCQTLY